MNEKVIWIVAALAVAALAAALYFMRGDEEPAQAPELQWPEAAPDASAPPIRHPVPATPDSPDEEPLPALAESDPALRESATTLFGGEPIDDFLVPENIVRHIVVTVDNLARKKIAVQMRPVKPIEGTFVVEGTEQTLSISPGNYERYKPFVRLVEATDAEQLAELYFHFYPLFQESYEALGYPGRYFNDRAVEMIDHLLETPEVQGEIRLKRPHVLYEFADPELEGLSAGQKALLRMGPGNAAIVKRKLSEIRAAISRQETPAPNAPQPPSQQPQ